MSILLVSALHVGDRGVWIRDSRLADDAARFLGPCNASDHSRIILPCLYGEENRFLRSEDRVSDLSCLRRVGMRWSVMCKRTSERNSNIKAMSTNK